MTNVRDAETLDRSAIDMLLEDIGVEDLVSLLDTYFDYAPALSAAMDEGLGCATRRPLPCDRSASDWPR